MAGPQNGVFSTVDDQLKGEIFQHASQYGNWQTAVRYGREIGMTAKRLYEVLEEAEKVKEPDKRFSKVKERPQERELDAEETLFLERVRAGDVGLDEASRKVAALVFEKMLKNPNDVRFGDFFKVEFLKIKQTEVQDKKNAATDMIHAMFGGKLPPKICPQCGYKLFTESVTAAQPVQAIEGEIVDD